VQHHKLTIPVIVVSNFSLYISKIALKLIFILGKQEAVDTILAALHVVPEPLRGFALVLVEVCAYAGKLRIVTKSY